MFPEIHVACVKITQVFVIHAFFRTLYGTAEIGIYTNAPAHLTVALFPALQLIWDALNSSKWLITQYDRQRQ